MDNLVVGVIIGASVMLFLVMAIAGARAGSLGGVFRGLTLAGRAKHDPKFAEQLAALEAGAAPKPPEPPKPAKPSGAALRALALLQAEARLVDFLMEDISGAKDEQIGQAVRKVHDDARKALQRFAVIEPVLPGKEDETVTVPTGFDPSAIRVVGNVTGAPPFTGQIQHPGWRVKELKVAPPPEGADEFVLQPAEVQIP